MILRLPCLAALLAAEALQAPSNAHIAITGPAPLAKAVGAKPALAGEYTIACDAKAPDITFVLGGRRYDLALEDYVIEESGQCLFGMMAIDLQGQAPLWILGDVFMRKYYVKFDVGQARVGLALAK